jgi:hypothetical protein
LSPRRTLLRLSDKLGSVGRSSRDERYAELLTNPKKLATLINALGPSVARKLKDRLAASKMAGMTKARRSYNDETDDINYHNYLRSL